MACSGMGKRKWYVVLLAVHTQTDPDDFSGMPIHHYVEAVFSAEYLIALGNILQRDSRIGENWWVLKPTLGPYRSISDAYRAGWKEHLFYCVELRIFNPLAERPPDYVSAWMTYPGGTVPWEKLGIMWAGCAFRSRLYLIAPGYGWNGGVFHSSSACGTHCGVV